MPEHHPKNVTKISKWCPVCRAYTLHRVDFKREGSCTEHKAKELSSKQEKLQAAREKAEREPTLF